MDKTCKKLENIHTNNDGEYCDYFDGYCISEAFDIKKIPPKKPQLHGLSNRINKTLVQKVKCLLLLAKFPRSF